jgi:hypothetical protein
MTFATREIGGEPWQTGECNLAFTRLTRVGQTFDINRSCPVGRHGARIIGATPP